MKKETAVEYLIQYMMNNQYFVGNDLEDYLLLADVFEQAKAMEKEQIVDAYVECYMNHVGNGESILREANSVYTKTYGGDK